jgi:hypothetical protein
LLSPLEGADSEISLVVASQVPLHILFPDEPNRTSPLVGLCKTLDVRPVSLEQVQKFVVASLNGTGIEFTKQQVQQLHHDSLGRPGEILDLAHQLYQELVKTRD